MSMNESGDEARQTRPAQGRKMWWLLPLLVLVVLIGLIYVLGHMSSADSEMYPTTRCVSATPARLC
jgi:hypothetical protein